MHPQAEQEGNKRGRSIKSRESQSVCYLQKHQRTWRSVCISRTSVPYIGIIFHIKYVKKFALLQKYSAFATLLRHLPKEGSPLSGAVSQTSLRRARSCGERILTLNQSICACRFNSVHIFGP